MFKKILFWILVFEIIFSWPLSLVQKPNKISFDTIFFPATQEEELSHQTKLSLDTSKIKKIYYNKITIVKDRYFKNVLILMDPNNYFFSMHPREDISGINYRFKYPFWAVLFLIPAIKVTVNNKKYFKIWLILLLEILCLSFLKNFDKVDLILIFPLDILLILGVKELNKYKYSWLINLFFVFLMAIEIWRIFV